MTKSDAIIANSNYTKAHIIREHGTAADQIIVIPRGVDMAYFDPSTVNLDTVQNLLIEWKIGVDDKVVLLPGRLTNWKGQMVAILALSKLPNNYKLVLLGDAQGRNDYVNELWELAEQQDVENQIIIPGHTSEIASALAASDIVISPSTDPEAFGRVVTEAQAMGCPVIASAHGGPMETVIEGQTGFLVKPGEAHALSSAIEKALNWGDYDAVFARTHIEQNFSKVQLQSATLGVYTQLMM